MGAEDIENFHDVYNIMICAVLEDKLGHSKYLYRSKEIDNNYNVFFKKKLKTSFDDTEIFVSRDRNGDFQTAAPKSKEK